MENLTFVGVNGLPSRASLCRLYSVMRAGEKPCNMGVGDTRSCDTIPNGDTVAVGLGADAVDMFCTLAADTADALPEERGRPKRGAELLLRCVPSCWRGGVARPLYV